MSPRAKSSSAASARKRSSRTRARRSKLLVNLIEPTGAETHVFGRLGADDVIAVVRERLGYAEGAEIGVSIAPENIHLFSASTQARVN